MVIGGILATLKDTGSIPLSGMTGTHDVLLSSRPHASCGGDALRLGR